MQRFESQSAGFVNANAIHIDKATTKALYYHRKINIIMSVLPKGKSLTASAGTYAAVLPKAGLPPQTQEPRL